jgi:ribosomal protein S21
MAIFAQRRENETVEKLIHRFKKQVQGTRLVQAIREQKHWTQKDNKRSVRISALKRNEYRQKRKIEQYS